MQNKGEALLARVPVVRAFLHLTLPALLTTLVSTLYSLTDAYFIGLLRDSAQLAAISIAMPVLWIVSALSGIFSAGAPQLISMNAGKSDRDGVRRCASLCVWGTLALSLILTPFALALIQPSLRAMGADGEILRHSAEYLRIVLAATAISSVSGALQGVLRALGRTSRASLGSIAGVLVNLMLDPLLILKFDMGMRGAAIATALGSVASLMLTCALSFGEFSLTARPRWQDMRPALLISLASTVPSIITSLTVACSFRSASAFGDGMMSAISVCSKLYSVFVSVVSALAFGMQPFFGYNRASENGNRLRSGLRLSLFAGSAVCLLGTGLFLFQSESLLRMFTDDATILSNGVEMLRCFAVGLPFAALLMNAMSYLSSTGRAAASLTVALGRQLIVFLPALVLLQSFFGAAGLMIAYPLTDVLTSIPAILLSLRDPLLRPGHARS